MRAGDDDEFATRGFDPNVERPPKCKLRRGDVDDLGAKRIGNRNGRIGGTRINQYDFDILDRLLFDPFEQTPDEFLFILGADDDGAFHELFPMRQE